MTNILFILSEEKEIELSLYKPGFKNTGIL